MWRDEALCSEEHYDRIDELVYQEADRDFTIAHNLPAMLDIVMKNTLRLASLICYTQNDVKASSEERNEQEKFLFADVAKAQAELAETAWVVKGLTERVDELNRENGDLTVKLKSATNVKARLEEKLSLVENDLDKIQELLVLRDDRVK